MCPPIYSHRISARLPDMNITITARVIPIVWNTLQLLKAGQPLGSLRRSEIGQIVSTFPDSTHEYITNFRYCAIE